ncbi:MAG: phosphotransferase [Alphaproteobacteria bacterium]
MAAPRDPDRANPTQGRRILPILHSIVDADALCAEIDDHYDLPQPLHCELLARGMNDVYVLRCGGERLAVRLWNARGRTADEVVYELDYLDFLHGEGLPVSPALPTRAGPGHFSVEAPEGRRYVALFHWAEGAEIAAAPTVENAAELGALIGRLHLVSPRFPGGDRRKLDHANSIRRDFPALARRLGDRPEDLAFYRRVAKVLPDTLDRLGPEAPMSPTHGDTTPFNAFVKYGRVTLMDFETCGYGHMSHELGSFCWSAAKNNYPPEIAAHFLAAYDAVRPRDQAERDLFPFFQCVKDFTQLCGLSAGINAVGYAAFRFRGFDWAAESVRRHVRAAGLL